MARPDMVGFFWDDTPPPKVIKEVVKRTPPEPVWLRPDYLPGLDEALAFNVPVMSRNDLSRAFATGQHLLLDVESYPNYFLAGFMSFKTGAVVQMECNDEQSLTEHDAALLRWLLESFTTVGFNSNSYDMPIQDLAIAGMTAAKLFEATQSIIVDGMRGGDLCRAHKAKRSQANHIDLIEVAPLSASLKIYGGRLHVPKMQDLPFAVGATLSDAQKSITRWYNVNDLTNTAFLYKELLPQIELRQKLGLQYGADLRSKSDAQIAETVIAEQVGKLNGSKPKRPDIAPGTCYRYQPPSFLNYKSELMQWTLNRVCEALFVVSEDGTIGMPEQLKSLAINIGGGVYRMGIGGLHSSEQKAIHKANSNTLLIDRDVASYYPAIILNTGMFPEQMGRNFLTVYRQIVEQRLAAKSRGDKVVADSLKITINGTFGKLGSPYSTLNAPNLLIQVTVTGQLALLMLIERLELAGIQVVSANTDGIVIKCPVELQTTMDSIVKQWEADTGFDTEATNYSALYCRDVNNYIAVKLDGTVKTKGIFSNPWADPKQSIFKLHKNPQNQICVEAVIEHLVRGIPVATTVHACDDVRKFVCVRTVKGGAVKDGVYLGKAIRWYYAEGEAGEIVYASSGNKVPRSDGAKPLMTLPETCPADVDRNWYIREAESMLEDLGLIGSSETVAS